MKPFEFIIDLGKNIIAGTRAALFMSMQLWLFKSNYLQVCLLLIVSLGLSIVHDYYETAPDNYFNPYGLSYQALLYLLFFFSLSLIAVFNNRQQDLEKLIVLFLSIVPVVWLGTICLLLLAKQQTYLDEYQSSWLVFILYSFWYLLIAGRLFKRFFYLRIIPVLLCTVLYGIINFTPLFLLPTESLWYALPTETQITQPAVNVDIEAVYYSQTALLEKASNNLIESEEETTDLFFLGFAGDADEDVFMNEAKSAQHIVDGHFNALGRSFVLINNMKTIDDIPLANGHNLKKAVSKIAKKMDKEEDIFVLFLTSHGHEDHQLSTNFSPFRLNDISPVTIKEALDNAEIKWRVIIVSACYAGGFIEPLANANTLLITAAKPDRQSFGCGHDGQYTYFGDAYFENGLKQTQSFIKAFDLASEIIRQRENEEGFENSEPQIDVGNEIRNKLAEFEKELEVKRSLNWASTAIN